MAKPLYTLDRSSALRAQVEDIEPRILYSADAAAIGLEVSADLSLANVAVVDPVESVEASNSQHQITAPNLVVLDGDLDQLATLLDDLQDQRSNGALVDWLVIDGGADGISILSDYLQQSQVQYGAVHILTHGAAGEFELGGQTVNGQTLRLHAAEIGLWSVGLTANADLQIYGCDLAGNSSGTALINDIAILTGADVAASNDPTGHASLGGDWVLEFRSGHIETVLPLSHQVTQSWVGRLDIDLTGSEQVVNQTISGSQAFRNDHGGRQIASNGTDMVVVWEDGPSREIFFRLYDADGTPRAGGEQSIENTGDWHREEPAVAMVANGDFIIVWTSVGQDGDKDGIYAQRFAADGTPQARPVDAIAGTYSNAFEFRVNSTTAEEQRRAAVATRDDGTFVIAWEARSTGGGFNTYNAMYRSYNADGSRIGFNTDNYVFLDFVDLEQQNVAITAGPSAGNAIVAFQYENSSGNYEIRLREIQPNGATGAMISIVNSGADLVNPQVDMNAAGNYAVIYENSANGGVIEVARFDSAGISLDGNTPIVVTPVTAGSQEHPSLALTGDGRILAVWEAQESSGGRDDIVAREIAVNGLLAGSEIVVPVTTNNNQLRPDVVISGSAAAVVWDDHGPSGTDDVMMRTITLPAADVLVSSGGVITGEDGSFVDIAFVLAIQPTDDVVISVSTTDPGEGLPSLSSLSFSASNWNVTQTVRVQGQDDPLLDGDIDYAFNYTISSTGDARYNSLSGGSIALTNQDDELPGASTVGPVSDVDTNANQLLEDSPSGTFVGIRAFASDPVVPGDVSYSLISNPGNLFAIDSINGDITLGTGMSLDREIAQAHTITVRATSTDTSVSEQDFVISVLDVNDNAPLITTTNLSVAENSAIGTLVGISSASDPDSTGSLQLWTITGGSGASAFSIDSSSGEIQVTDPSLLDFESAPTLTLDLTVSDGLNTSPVQTITVTVNDQPEAPLSANTTITVVEDTNYIFSISDFPFSDPDSGDQLSSITIDALPTSGTLEVNGVAASLSQSISRLQISSGSLVYLPAANISGNAATSISITVYDFFGLPASNSNVISIDISAVNDAPQFVFGGGAPTSSITVAENNTAVATVLASDVDDIVLFYDISGGADATRFNIDSSGQLTLTVGADFEAPNDANSDGTYEVQVRARDALNAEDRHTLFVSVSDQPEGFLVTAPAAIAALEDQTILFSGGNSVDFSDPDLADELSVSISASSGLFTLTNISGLAFSAGDGAADTAMAFNGTLSDINAALLSLQYQPEENSFGSTDIEITITDPASPTRSLQHVIALTIASVNDTPMVSGSLLQGVSADNTTTLLPTTLNVIDIEDSAAQLTFQISQAPVAGVLLLDGAPIDPTDVFTQNDINTGRIAYQVTSAATDLDSIGFTVTDTDGASVGSIEVFFQHQALAIIPPGQDSETADGRAPSSNSRANDSTLVGDKPIDGNTSSESPALSQAPAPAPLSDRGIAAKPLPPGGDDADSLASGFHDSKSSKAVEDRRLIAFRAQFHFDGLEISQIDADLAGQSNQEAAPLQTASRSGNYLLSADLNRTVDALREQITEGAHLEQQIIVSTATATAGFSLGYALWLIRSGALLSSVLASMPAWRSIDPIPILSNLSSGATEPNDDRSLKEILAESAKQAELKEADVDFAGIQDPYALND